ncbi:TlpA disulfide reductase family protein [Caulobacter sp. S45]|uniref:TlpA disulfide reductase family protein n=1 Tax=Caulobacter sp. S45 TaxID=1641861 RepID=UPI00131E4A48|nr:TlpA disulfide reductase family protein [Caulobacter sp. S45]
MIRAVYLAVAVATALTVAPPPTLAGPAATLSGGWSAVAKVNGADIPFRLDLAERSGVVRATFFDGTRPTNPSAPGTIASGRLLLLFPSYAATLDVSVDGGVLDGTYTRNHTAIPIHAVKGAPGVPAAPHAPSISGEWIVPKASAKGEQAWRLIVHQAGGEISAAILRVDGDTGTLNGRYVDGAFHLSHFAGERPALLEIRVQPDGRLKLDLTDSDGHADLVGLRPKAALAQGLAPADPTRFTGVKDPSAPFAFAFPDLAGHKVANTDARFRGKVVVVDVMGSWCPNCHDEAPFLQALYAKHHRQGLEVVALDFEQPDQLADPQRLRAFVQRYGITYTVLLAGDPKAVHEKLPQAVNLSAWPTTFFVGRDGRVKGVHVGFTSPGSGVRDAQTRAAAEREVETMLARPST